MSFVPNATQAQTLLRLLFIEEEPAISQLKPSLPPDKRTAMVDAGLIAHKLIPTIILINLMDREIDANQVCKYVRTNEYLSDTLVIDVANNLSDNETQALHQKGFDAVISNQTDTAAVMNVIQEVTAIIY